jgi:hypothetical protein
MFSIIKSIVALCKDMVAYYKAVYQLACAYSELQQQRSRCHSSERIDPEFYARLKEEAIKAGMR